MQWKQFRIGDLFEVYTGGDMIIGNLKNGDIPLISHKNTDNGVAKYIAKVDNAKIFDYTKTISLADRGCFCASTQNQNFYIGTRVKALVFKESDNVTKNIRLFFVCAINKLQVFFTEYSSNATDKLPTLKIKLPTDKNGQIDFEFMESFISAVQKEVIKSVVLWSEKRIQVAKQSIL